MKYIIPIFKGDCPHCGTLSVAFSQKATIQSGPGGHRITDVFAQCGYCARGLMAMVPRAVTDPRDLYRPGVDFAPSLPNTDAPASTPENVARYFKQGMENMPRNPDAAGTMFRKTLETALKARFPEFGGTLIQRIQKAADDGALTRDMAEWAHHIRRLGNAAVHEDEPFSEDDARDLRSFTDLLLRYLFTLPGMLAEALGATENGELQA